ncbi:MAG: type II toxin-antitoxin system Phd/YefM family antitoxin [Alphaproteobacteria bacterium]|nr:type II toxin-antitoxin system Phd/YefM family antitoxin [Alphaproteobacteria bacterium]
MDIGAYEAKTHFSQLLERAEKGERITITKHGRPVAMLVPADAARPLATGDAGLRRAARKARVALYVA